MLVTWQRRFHRVYTSPLSRAHHTAQHIAKSLELPIDIHPELKEGFLGILEGVTYQELYEFGFARHSIKDDNFSGHNGESPNQLGTRMNAAMQEIRNRHPEENLIVVSHGAAIAHYMAKILGTRPAFGHQYLMHNAAVTEIRFEPEKAPEVVTLNHHEHLPDHLKMDPTGRDQNVSKK